MTIDLLCVVLHPASLGVVLLVVDVGTCQHAALFIEQQCLGRRGALVNSNDIIHKAVANYSLFTFHFSLFTYEVQYGLRNSLSIHAVVMENLGIGAVDNVLVGDADDADGNGILAQHLADHSA